MYIYCTYKHKHIYILWDNVSSSKICYILYMCIYIYIHNQTFFLILQINECDSCINFDYCSSKNEGIVKVEINNDIIIVPTIW